MTEKMQTEPDWGVAIPEVQWNIYVDAIRVIRKSRARSLLGGAFGLAYYTHRWRNTKDLDFFVLPSEKDQVIDALTKAGFEDLYDKLPYDRGWIYRCVRNDVIVDTIWQTPNRRTEVDTEWFRRSRKVMLRGEQLEVIPAEELLAIKLYVLQRDRCDWPDLLNLLYTSAGHLDWNHVLNRLNGEKPLLGGLLQVFNWLAPSKAVLIPDEIRNRFCLKGALGSSGEEEQDRVRLLDSRGWFAAYEPPDKPMQL